MVVLKSYSQCAVAPLVTERKTRDGDYAAQAQLRIGGRRHWPVSDGAAAALLIAPWQPRPRPYAR